MRRDRLFLLDIVEAAEAIERFLTGISESEFLEEELYQAAVLQKLSLIRRGYKAEEITGPEYERLLELMKGTEEADPDDVALHDFGNHRALYDYLTEGLGIYVEPGRGPVWGRARELARQHERDRRGRG